MTAVTDDSMWALTVNLTASARSSDESMGKKLLGSSPSLSARRWRASLSEPETLKSLQRRCHGAWDSTQSRQAGCQPERSPARWSYRPDCTQPESPRRAHWQDLPVTASLRAPEGLRLAEFHSLRPGGRHEIFDKY